jgi:hypothetical protein
MTQRLTAIAIVLCIALALVIGACSEKPGSDPGNKARVSANSKAAELRSKTIDLSAIRTRMDSVRKALATHPFKIPDEAKHLPRMFFPHSMNAGPITDPEQLQPGQWAVLGPDMFINVMPPCTLVVGFVGATSMLVDVVAVHGPFASRATCAGGGYHRIPILEAGLHQIAPRFGAPECNPEAALEPATEYDDHMFGAMFLGPHPDGTTHVTIEMEGTEPGDTSKSR